MNAIEGKNGSNGTSKSLKRKKGKSKNIAITILVFLIIILLLIYLFIFFSDSKDDSENIGSDNNSNNVFLTEEEKRLKELDNIDKKLSFFKKDYIDRYIAYKNNNPDLDIEKVIVYVNIGLDQKFYTNVSASPNQDKNTILVNKFYSVAEDFVPKNLETIDSKYSSSNRLMTTDARIAFENMAKDAKSEGYNIRAISTYRSYKYQSNLYSNYVKEDGVEKADTYSARAGSSEHHTGLAVDVDNIKVSYTSFGSTKEFEWMKENAYKYGFILRYTKDNEFITGYKDEPWHYRYVGVEIATYIQNNPMSYEEYYVRFLDN